MLKAGVRGQPGQGGCRSPGGDTVEAKSPAVLRAFRGSWQGPVWVRGSVEEQGHGGDGMRPPETWKGGRVTRRAVCGVLVSSGDRNKHHRPGGSHSSGGWSLGSRC